VTKGNTGRRTERPAFGKDFGLGWVGFVYCPGRLLSGGIAYLTRRAKKNAVTVSHAFLVTGPNECIEANLPVGVVTSDLAKDYLDRDDLVVLFRKPLGLTSAIARRVVSSARAQVGAKFDVGGIAAEGMHGTFLGHLITSLFGDKPRELIAGLLHQDGRWVCSELVAYCLRQVPRYRERGVLVRPPGTVSPQELLEDSALFEPSPSAASRRAPRSVKRRRTETGR
jgi:hypothetical protein